MPWLINFLAFQLGWLACVLAGAHKMPWLGTLTALLIIALHLGALRLSRTRPVLPEIGLIMTAALLGAILDSILATSGLLIYPSGVLLPGTAPHWIIAMWMLFATTLNVSLSWLRGRWLLALLLGLIGGPLAYYAGHRLGGVEFAQPLWQPLLALALCWALAMPLLSILAVKFVPSLGAQRGPEKDPVTV
jgi:hypothetical protein